MKKTTALFKGIIICVCMLSLIFSISTVSYAMNFEFKEASKSVFVIIGYDSTGTPTSLGSGFAFDENYILTNAHVIENMSKVEFGTYSETAEMNIGNIYPATVVAKDSNMDIAVLHTDSISLIPLEMADASTIKEGDDVYAIGAPEGLPYTLTSGKISNSLRDVNGIKYVQTDAPINHGNSGGPLLNEDGQVIGMNTMKITSGENLGFAIRVDAIQAYLEQYKVYNSAPSTAPSPEPIPEPVPDIEYDPYYDPYYVEKSNLLPMIIIIVVISNIVAGAVIFAVVATKKKNSRREDDDLYSIPIVDDNGNPVNQVMNFDKAAEKIPEPAPAPIPTPAPAPKPNPAPVYNTAPETELDKYGVITILSGIQKGTEVRIRHGEEIVLGKDKNVANIVFESAFVKVSRKHCSVFYDKFADEYTVVDHSSNGTYLARGSRLPKGMRVPLARGTLIKLADDSCQIRFM